MVEQEQLSGMDSGSTTPYNFALWVGRQINGAQEDYAHMTACCWNSSSWNDLTNTGTLVINLKDTSLNMVERRRSCLKFQQVLQ
jgi:hypothetical protein